MKPKRERQLVKRPTSRHGKADEARRRFPFPEKCLRLVVFVTVLLRTL
ncbi:MAG: hypothetical protein QXG97_06675 [Nitrososphaerota archaeon]